MPAPLRAAGARLRAAARPGAGYPEFRDEAEPALLAHPRVHRFAQVPIVGAPATRAARLAVCIDTQGGGDAAATRSSLDAQTVAPAEVVESPDAGTLGDTRASWVVVVGAGDRLAPVALERLGQAVTLAPDAVVLTCDEDVLRRGGERTDPVCRPGPSPDSLLAGVQAGPPIAVAREPALAAGASAGSGWVEPALCLAGPDGGGHAHVPLILLHRWRPREADDEAEAAAVRAVHDGVRVEQAGPGLRRVHREIAGEPSVEVVICFRDRPRLLERCVRSILDRTTYEHLSLRLVDNHSSQPALLTLLDVLAGEPRITIVHDNAPFNFSAINNRAVHASRADYVVLLNNDTEVVTPTWIEDLLEEAQREEVGAVGPLLTYADGSVQHAGAALGLHGYAGHPFAGLGPEEATPFGAASDGTRNWLAVTAACMMVSRSRFESVGGLDESFAVGGNDVDLCLRLTEAGHRSLCVPHAVLMHDESASRDPMEIPEQDFVRSRESYGAFRTVGDPFYNPNLTLADTSCGLRGAAEPEA